MLPINEVGIVHLLPCTCVHLMWVLLGLQWILLLQMEEVSSLKSLHTHCSRMEIVTIADQRCTDQLRHHGGDSKTYISGAEDGQLKASSAAKASICPPDKFTKFIVLSSLNIGHPTEASALSSLQVWRACQDKSPIV